MVPVFTGAFFPKMYIREYITSDQAGCLDLFRSNMPLFFAEHEFGDYVEWLDKRNVRRQAYKNSQSEMYYVLENDGIVCACGGFYVTQDESEARMCWGMVDRKFHKKGFGTILLEYRIEKIKELFPSTTIALDTSQHSFTFFEKLGFRTTKVTENSYAEGLHRYDMVLPAAVLKEQVQP